MSKTLFIEFRGQGFWACDVVSGIFLKHMIDSAVSPALGEPASWLAEAVNRWRFNAICGDCGLFLDENWSVEQVRTVKDLAIAACALLSRRHEISAEEMSSWSLLDGEGVGPRGYESVAIGPVIHLGRAIVQVLDGTLPEAPRGTWWFFGVDGEPKTIMKRQGLT